MKNTKIEWAHHTFNPWIGCQKISPACDHCYAATRAKRVGEPELWEGERRRTTPDNWRQPLKWDRDAAARGVRERVFCASLADVFDNVVPDEWRHDLWELIAKCRNLDWLLLTKRIGNARYMLPVTESGRPGYRPWTERWPWSNVWIGSTFENQFVYDRDIEKLLALPARVRFASIEPMLGPIQLGLKGTLPGATFPGYQMVHERLHWVIAGGESGGKARPSNPEWFRALRDECVEVGTPFLFKQWGEWGVEISPPVWETHRWPITPDERYGGVWSYRVGKKRAGRHLDGRLWDDVPVAA